MNNRYCLTCMEALGEGQEVSVCPRCGKSADSVSPHPHHLQPGTMLGGRFQVGVVIGEGGFGITYIGRDINLDIRVAVKEYYPTGYANRNNTASATVTANTGPAEIIYEKGRDSFLNEARILARFYAEPGIVGVRDFFTANNTAYIVMDYIDGVTLERWLTEHGMIPVERALALFDPVLKSLSHIHAQGLIHRDISPDNLMLTRDGSVKLLDFGAARQSSGPAGRDLTVMLKPGYAPEEQFRGNSVQGPWTDVYALCATIYKCVTNETPDNAMERVFNDSLQPPSALGIAIAPRVEAVLLKGMAVLQQNRFQTVDELQEAIRESVTSLPAAQPPTVFDENRTMLAVAAEAAAPVKEFLSVIPPPAPVEPQPIDQETPAVTPATEAAPPPEQGAEVPEAPEKSVNRKREKRAKKKRPIWQRILLLLLAAVGLVIVAFVVWLILSLMKNNGTIQTTGQRVVNRETGVAVYLADDGDRVVELLFPPTEETWAELQGTDKIISLTVGYTVGLDGASLDHIAQMSDIVTLNLGGTFRAEDDDVPVTLDLSPLAGMPMLETLRLVSFADVDPAQLQGCATLETLRISDSTIANMAGFAELSALYTLEISNSIDDLTGIKGPKSLRYLRLPENQISSVEPLRDIGSPLVDLELDSNLLTSLTGLENCVTLDDLSVDNNLLHDLTGLEGCVELSDLSARDCKLTSLQGLENCKALRIAFLSGNQLTDLGQLAGMAELNQLDISENLIGDISGLSEIALTFLTASKNQISDLEPLRASWDRMQTIEISHNRLTDLNGLSDHIRLKTFIASNNEISDISGLSNCTQLMLINLNNNRISNLTGIAKNTGTLASLFLDNNQVSDISPLRGMTELLILAMDGNQVSDLSPLTDSPLLSALFLHNNQIADVAPLAELTQLVTLDLSNNRLTDISPLSSFYPINAPALGMMLDVSNNLISDISPLPSGKDLGYSLLGLDNNPITDFSRLAELGVMEVTISYRSGLDYAPFSEAPGWNGQAKTLYIADVPNDQRIAIENTFKESGFTTGSFNSNRLRFVTSQEIADFKQEKRAAVIGASDGERDPVLGGVVP